MSNQCFRCASTDHKTPNCPKDPNNQVTQTIKIDLTGAVKRPAGAIDGPDAKRLQMISMVDEEIPRPPEPELQQLYEEYSLSRQRYTYYRERLQKEIHAKRNGMAGSVYVTPFAPTLGATSTQYCLMQLLHLSLICFRFCVQNDKKTLLKGKNSLLHKKWPVHNRGS
ncbi:unnamed protein product [Nippostrongylus brasiliensis]|uniref:RNA-binding protein rnp-1 (inferred by orthology to a C. elegans protein) n=1 Tax=Nippostrongylus brasiliensis TaxID=27835 RepID=A0A0N4XPB2_NIPBR|nr:unnamed protein product [Nippostrongylus brasiliensis]